MDHSYSHAEKLQAVCVACEAPDLPNVRAVAAALTAKDPTQNVVSLEGSARACIDPAIQWFLQKVNVQLYHLVAAFKARSTNYVSSCSTVVETYSSERFGSPYLSLLGQ